MTTRLLEAFLWTTAAVAVLVAWVVWRRSLQVPHVEPPIIARVLSLPRAPAVDTLARIGKSIVDSDPFRIARRPAASAFGAEPVIAVVAAPPPLPPKPTLRLRGIIGPPWEAIVDGLPQRSTGTVVRSGERIGELQIGPITRGTIRVTGMDTVWTLTLERTWR